MGFLGQNSDLFQRLAVFAGTLSFWMQLDRYHQTTAADFLYQLGADALKLAQKLGFLFGGVFDHAFLHENAEGRPRDGARERIAAEGVPCSPGRNVPRTSLLESTADTG